MALLVSMGYSSGSMFVANDEFRLNVCSGNSDRLVAPLAPRALFCAIIRTLASGQPAMGELESGRMLVRTQKVCSFMASHSGAKLLIKRMPSESSSVSGDHVAEEARWKPFPPLVSKV